MSAFEDRPAPGVTPQRVDHVPADRFPESQPMPSSPRHNPAVQPPTHAPTNRRVPTPSGVTRIHHARGTRCVPGAGTMPRSGSDVQKVKKARVSGPREARRTGIEPATSGPTVRCSNQLSYRPGLSPPGPEWPAHRRQDHKCTPVAAAVKPTGRSLSTREHPHRYSPRTPNHRPNQNAYDHRDRGATGPRSEGRPRSKEGTGSGAQSSSSSRILCCIWALSRARIDECIWLTRLSDRSSVAPISFIVIAS